MTKDSRREESLFARLLCDVMIPAELAEALRAQGYDVAGEYRRPTAGMV